MPTGDDIDAVLAEVLAASASTLGIADFRRLEHSPFELADGNLILVFDGIPHLNEIQVAAALETSGGRERLSTGDLHAWLGEPGHTFMFSALNMREACGLAARFAERVVERYRRDPALALTQIRAIESGGADSFFIEEDRREANDAWARQDYALASRFYEKIADHLTPVERKRLDIARKKGS